MPRAITVAGLNRVSALPVGRGFVEGTIGWTPKIWHARLEAGYHPIEPLALFGFVEAGTSGPMAGAGVRYLF